MSEPSQSDLAALMAAREEIDRTLLRDHRANLAVLFTDIVGSTELFERKGDLEGLAFVKRHNELLFPLVAQHQGRVVKTIGDAIMAVFDPPEGAVRCAAQMQRCLLEDRKQNPGQEPIHIRIGVHAGEVMLDDGDVFGDVVNTAARIEAKGNADEVLVSNSAFAAFEQAGSALQGEGSADSLNLQAESRGTLQLKGKAESFPVLLLLWNGASPATKPAPKPAGRGLTQAVGPRSPLEVTGPARALPQILVLDLMSDPQGIKASVMDGEQDKGPLRSYATQNFGSARAADLEARFDTYLGGNATSYTKKLRALGESLWREALPESVRARLETTERHFVRLQVDESLADLPWELAHEGQTFLGLKFAMGRVIATRDTESPRRPPSQGDRAVALVVSDPSGDLPAAREEGRAIADLLREGFGGEVLHLEGPVRCAQLSKALADVRLLHFAGHVQWKQEGGGLVMSDGLMTATELVKAGGTGAPGLVFANSCYSAGKGEWRSQGRREGGLASALLLSGVRHFIGPSGPVSDREALRFSLRFWESTLAGERYGEAVRLAKVRLVEGDAHGLGFARYALYGEPRSALPPTLALKAPDETRSRSAEAGFPRRMVPPEFAAAEPPWYRSRLVLAGIGAALVGSLQFWVRHAWRSYEETKAQEITARQNPSAADGVRGMDPQVAGAQAPHAVSKTQGAIRPPPLAPKLPRSGPIAVSVLPFKGVGIDPELQFLSEGLSETVVTDFGESKKLRLIERGQVKLEIGEIDFSQSRYVDPETRAELGKIVGAELVIIGSYQASGKRLRATARFVDVATGEVITTAKAAGLRRDPFGLQDDLARAIRASLPTLEARLR